MAILIFIILLIFYSIIGFCIGIGYIVEMRNIDNYKKKEIILILDLLLFTIGWLFILLYLVLYINKHDKKNGI